MGHYTNNHCAVCFHDLIRPQNTCGARECLAEWKTWNATRRFTRKNLAHMSSSERTLIMQQGPSNEELQEQQAHQQQFAQELAEHESTKQHDLTPEFIRKAMDPSNLFRKDENDDSNTPIVLPDITNK